MREAYARAKAERRPSYLRKLARKRAHAKERRGKCSRPWGEDLAPHDWMAPARAERLRARQTAPVELTEERVAAMMRRICGLS